MGKYLPYLSFFISIVALALAFSKRKGDAPDSGLPYVRKDSFFSMAERSFYGVLKQTVGSRFEIFAHVRVADLLDVKNGVGKSEWQKAFNKINSRHVDFVLCKPNDLSVVACIELDDSSHNAARRNQRDDFINLAFATAEIPLLRFKAQASYSARDIALQLQQALEVTVKKKTSSPVKQAMKPLNAPTAPAASEQPPMLCPECSAVMEPKQATKGKYAGKYFWACTGFPACNKVVPIDDAAKMNL